MNTNKKLTLSSIKIRSFITTLDAKNKNMVKGGTGHQNEESTEPDCVTQDTETTRNGNTMCADSEANTTPNCFTITCAPPNQQ